MRAIRLHQFGSADNFRVETVDDPRPGPGQVRINVKASGVHLIETWLRSGTPVGPHPLPELPIVFGGEVAGVIDELGADVPQDWLGARVVVQISDGGYAELAVADVADLHRLPTDLDYPAAVAMITTGVTALAILDIAGLTAEDVVVVTAAAGGIGSLLVQAAVSAGATVVAAAGGETKTAYAKALGADIAVDYTAADWSDTVRGSLDGRLATVVMDGVGGSAAQDAYSLLEPGGRVVYYGAASESGQISTPEAGLEGGLRFQSLFESPIMGVLSDPVGSRRLQAESLAAAATGALVPGIETFPLAEAGKAHRALESRRTVGKVVLVGL